MAPFYGKCTPIFYLPYFPCPGRLEEAWTLYKDIGGGGILEGLELIATVWLSQLAFTSCFLIVFTNHRNVLALP